MNILHIVIVIFMFIGKFCNGIFEFNRGIHTLDNKVNIDIPDESLLSAVVFAEESMMRLKRLEDAICKSRINITEQSISFAQLLENLPNEKSKELDKTGQVIFHASVKILHAHCTKYGYNVLDCARAISKFSLPSDLFMKCNQIKLDDERSLKSNIYRRLLPASYKDGLYKMSSSHRPSPKNISDTLFNAHKLLQNSHNSDKNRSSEGIFDPILNIAVVQWAQFIEHDLVKTVVRTMSNNCPIECCEKNLSDAPPRYIHPACSPLKITGDFGRYVTCFSYVRSAVGVHPDCKFGAANQINQATNNFDLSQLYGIKDEVTHNLRRFVNGEILASNDPDYESLPSSDESEKLCIHNSEEKNACYKSGDSRVNVNPYVTPLYTIFLRSHNRFARTIRETKKSWEDERIFNFARKLNTLIYRKIVYNEWAKIVLGKKNVKEMIDEVSSTVVDENNDALSRAISNEFATAGIRFYYSMMPGECVLKRNIDMNSMSVENNVIIKNSEYYKPISLGINNELDVIMDAILNQNAMAMDSAYVDDVTKYMYRFKYSDHTEVGTDVLALDLLRGRDHGLADYKSYLEGCTNKVITTWDDLGDYITQIFQQNLDRLKTLYSSVDTIDLIVGAISEKPLNDAAVGPTFACIIGEQLKNTLRSEYNMMISIHDNNFAKEIIHNYDAARLICETTRLMSVPKNIFKLPSRKNVLVDCSIYRSNVD